jgi:hypothetical protein
MNLGIQTWITIGSRVAEAPLSVKITMAANESSGVGLPIMIIYLPRYRTDASKKGKNERQRQLIDIL